jgi:hypothetical protein
VTEPRAGARCTGPMRRRICLLPLAALLLLPGAAPAKEIGSLALCGVGECHGVKGEAAKRGFEDSSMTAPAPDRPEPFLELRVGIKAHEGERIPGFSLRYLPESGVLRGTDESGYATFTRPSPALASALGRAARGLERKPAAKLGSLRRQPVARAQVDEVFAPAASAGSGGSGGDDGGVPWPVPVAGATALALGLAALARRRARRRRAGGAAPVVVD